MIKRSRSKLNPYNRGDDSYNKANKSFGNVPERLSKLLFDSKLPFINLNVNIDLRSDCFPGFFTVLMSY